MLEPLVEDVEDRQQPLLGRVRAALHLALEPVLRPALLAQAQELDDELVLGREVPVERSLGDAGVLQDRVDPDRLEAVVGEELVGGLEDPVADAERAGCGCHSSCSASRSRRTLSCLDSLRECSDDTALSTGVGRRRAVA